MNGLYAATYAASAQRGPHSEDTRYLKTIVTVKHWAAYSVDKYTGPDEPLPGEGGKVSKPSPFHGRAKRHKLTP